MKFSAVNPRLLLFVLACAAIPMVARAADPNSYLYIAHAAAGRNVSGAGNPDYPVDVSLLGRCIASGLKFGEIRGPFTLPAGAYAFRVSVANALAPCSGTVVFAPSIALSAGSTSLGIVEVNSAHQIVGQIFSVDLSPVGAGSGRLIVANTTPNALTGTLTAGDSTSASPQSASFAPGVVTVTPVGQGEYTATVYPQGSGTATTGPLEMDIVSRNVYLVVLAGTTSNHSVQLIGPEVIRDVF